MKKINTKLGSPERFGYAWNIANNISDVSEQQFLRWTKVIKNREYWKDKEIFEIGCGIGRNIYWPMNYKAKKALGIDLDDRTLKAAKKNLSGIKNIIIKKQSAYDISYKNKFDVVFSIGVIHHLEYPDIAIKKMVNSLKPGGDIIIWVYGYENMEYYVKILNPIRKIFFSKAPLKLVRLLSFIPSFLLLLIIKTNIIKIEYINFLKKMSFKEIQEIVFDQMIPQTAKYYKKEEALELLNNKYLTNITIEWVNECSWSLRATKKK